MRILTQLLLLISFSFTPNLIKAAPGDIDLSFGNGGLTIVPSSLMNNFKAQETNMVIDPSGKLLVAVSLFDNAKDLWNGCALVRVNPDGKLDPNFDGDGVVFVKYPQASNGFFRPCKLQVQTIGDTEKILVLMQWDKLNQYVLVRYHADGTFDKSFGMNIDAGIYDLAVDDKGLIYLGGTTYDDKYGSFGNNLPLISRFAPNGFVDTSFAGDGTVFGYNEPNDGEGIYFSGEFSKLLMRDNLIYAVGRGGIEKSVKFEPDKTYLQLHQARLVLNRFRFDGEWDSTFINSKIEGEPFDVENNSYEEVIDVGLYVDPITKENKLMVLGEYSDQNFSDYYYVVRFHSDGTPDLDFAKDGMLTFSKNFSSISSMAVQNNGKFLLTTTYNDQHYVTRYLANGTLDQAFGSGGFVNTTIQGKKTYSDAAVEKAGSIFVAGLYFPPENINQLAIFKLEGDLSLLQKFLKAPLNIKQKLIDHHHPALDIKRIP